MFSITLTIWQIYGDLVLIAYCFVFIVSFVFYDLPRKNDLEHNLKDGNIEKSFCP